MRCGTFGGRCQQRREENQYGLVHFFSQVRKLPGRMEVGTTQERERRRKILDDGRRFRPTGSNAQEQRIGARVEMARKKSGAIDGPGDFRPTLKRY